MSNRDASRTVASAVPEDPAAYSDAIFRTTRQPLLALDAALVVVSANPAFYACFAVGPDDTLGRPIFELGNRQWDIPDLRRLLEQVLGGRTEAVDHRIDHDFEEIGHRVVLVSARRVDRGDRPALVLLAFDDVTEREALRKSLAAEKEFADKVIDSVREGLLVLDLGLRVRSANQTFYQCFRVDPAETVGRLVYDLGNGQWDIPRLRQLLEHTLPDSGAFDDFEVEHHFESLGTRLMLLNARRVDHLDFILLAIRDVTELHKAQRQQQVLLGELQHRVKNIIANVAALSDKTLRHSRSLEDYGKAFQGRLSALSRAQDLFFGASDEPVNLRELIARELHAHGATEGTNYTAEGPDVLLRGTLVQGMQLALHELATNAVKHGALSTPTGRIGIEWTVKARDDGGVSRLQLRWQESGVVIEGPPTRKGYGSEVIERGLRYMLDADAVLDFRRRGLECLITLPLPAAEAPNAERPAARDPAPPGRGWRAGSG